MSYVCYSIKNDDEWKRFRLESYISDCNEIISTIKYSKYQDEETTHYLIYTDDNEQIEMLALIDSRIKFLTTIE